MDLGDARIVRGLLDGGTAIGPAQRAELHAALASKDTAALRDAVRGLPVDARRGLLALPRLYGGGDVLDAARRELPAHPLVAAALGDMARLAAHLQQAHPDVDLGVDLADLGGSAYYSGARFAVYAAACSDAVVRGGRYDEVGAVFGRRRPAVGFSLDVKEVAALAGRHDLPAGIRAPWREDAVLRAAVRRLREAGETVVCVLPGHEHDGQEFACDRELASESGQWVVRAL